MDKVQEFMRECIRESKGIEMVEYALGYNFKQENCVVERAIRFKSECGNTYMDEACFNCPGGKLIAFVKPQEMQDKGRDIVNNIETILNKANKMRHNTDSLTRILEEKRSLELMDEALNEDISLLKLCLHNWQEIRDMRNILADYSDGAHDDADIPAKITALGAARSALWDIIPIIPVEDFEDKRVPVFTMLHDLNAKLKAIEDANEEIRKLSGKDDASVQSILADELGEGQVKLYNKALSVLKNVRDWCAEQDPNEEVWRHDLIKEEVIRQFDEHTADEDSEDNRLSDGPFAK